MNEALEEEFIALKAIYEDSLSIHSHPPHGNDHAHKAMVDVAYTERNLTLHLLCGSGYPETALPSLRGSKDLLQHFPLCLAQIESFTGDLLSSSSSSLGAPILFQLIELFRGIINAENIHGEDSTPLSAPSLFKEEEEEGCLNKDSEVSSLNPPSISSLVFLPPLSSSNLRILHGEARTEKRSVFQAHIARVHSLEEVLLFKQTISEDKRFSRATHQILAYRFIKVKEKEEGEGSGGAIQCHDYGDDGETAAGGRLAELLRLMNVNYVAVMVSRWFGGVLLGPERFKHINNCARDLLEKLLVSEESAASVTRGGNKGHGAQTTVANSKHRR